MPASFLLRRVLTDTRPLDPLRAGPAPAFTLRALDGGEVSLEALGARPVVVHFWGSWCVQCRRQLPVLADARRRHPQLVVVGILFRDEPAEARDTLRTLAADWPVLVDPAEETARAYGVDSAPVVFFVDSAGRITGRVVGPLTPVIAERQLRRIL